MDFISVDGAFIKNYSDNVNIQLSVEYQYIITLNLLGFSKYLIIN